MTALLSRDIERVMSIHEPRVRAAAQRYGVDAGDLDLVLQDTRVRLWRLAEQGTEISSIAPALVYRMAANAAIDLLRRRDARREDSVDDTAPMAAPVGNALDRLALRDALQTCFARLLTARRAAVGLYLNGTPREEITVLLRWSEAKTRNLLYRGLDDLRDCLRSAGFAEGR